VKPIEGRFRPEAVIALFIIPKEKSYGHASAANLEGT
jgi:hypothetical protein